MAEAIHDMPYGQLKSALLEHFQGETMGQVRKLQGRRQGSQNLHEHNTKFSCQAAAARSQMSDREVKDLYVDSLAQPKVRDHQIPFLHLPLQQLQAKALDLAHAWKLTGSG